jgi:hypothetical protein
MSKIKMMVGADPELWIYDNQAKKIISADGLFPGTKEEPFKVPYGAIQVDGMAAEYNIDAVSKSKQFVFNNIAVLRSLRDEIKARNPALDFSFKFGPVAEFGAEYIAEQREEARRLGCTPDFDAYKDGQPNPAPDAEMPFRTASGHVHVGWGDDYDITDPEHLEACVMMAKQLDSSVGIYLLQLEGKAGKKRRKLYGKAGAFRPKYYGMEYRTPSNVWLADTHLMTCMFNGVRNAFDALMAGMRNYEEYPENHQDIVNAINESKLRWAVDNYGCWAAPVWEEHPVNVDTLDDLYANWYHYRDASKDELVKAPPNKFWAVDEVVPAAPNLGEILAQNMVPRAIPVAEIEMAGVAFDVAPDFDPFDEEENVVEVDEDDED